MGRLMLTDLLGTIECEGMARNYISWMTGGNRVMVNNGTNVVSESERIATAINNLPLGDRSIDMRELTEALKGKDKHTNIVDELTMTREEITRQLKIMNESLRVIAQQMRYR